MSYGSEVRAEMEINQMIAEDEERLRLRTGFWRRKDGSLISIKDMDDGYIRNCIARLRRYEYDEIGELWIKRFENEIEKRAG